MQPLTTPEILIPAACILFGILLGLFVEKFVLKRLHAVALRTLWRADNVLVVAFRGMPVVWGLIFGIYLAVQTTTADSKTEATLRTVLAVTLVWSITVVAARTAAGLIASYAHRDQTFLPPTSLIPNLVRILIYTVGLLIIIGRLGYAITPLLTALGVGGLAVALALQETLANVFAGLYLLAARQLNPGDWVLLDTGNEGQIVDINWRSTAVRTIQDNLVIVPNSKVASSTVTNYSLPEREMLIRIPMGVDYGSDLDQVERVTREVARQVMQEISGPKAGLHEPTVEYQALGEFGVNFVVYLPVLAFMDQYAARHLFIKQILTRYRTENIHIPFPIKEFEMQINSSAPEPHERRLEPPDASILPFK
ncbi:MAG TPA: mechanosensitive ion channel family protein [Rhodothermales bacterium]|nr:mechanosensitive ion channel family protein [Rhodothermales bacterium]